MKQQNPSRPWNSILFATLGLCAAAPFNIGGCSSDGIGSSVPSLPGGGGTLPGGATGGGSSGGPGLPGGLGGLSGIAGQGGTGGGNAGGMNYLGLGQGLLKAGQYGSMNEADEDQMGRSVAISITNEYGLDDNPKLTRYVNLVGMTLASVTPKPDGNWVFGVLDTNDVNAFSGPGGYVMVTRGAITRMKDESELAGVLAHEMTHVLRHHGLEAVKHAGLIDAASKAGSAVNNQAAAALTLSQGAVDVIGKKGYDRKQEAEADAGAVQLLVAAGYDPHGYQHYVERLAAEMGKGANLMSTHPGLGSRAKAIAEQANKADPNGEGATLGQRFERETKTTPP